MIGFIGICLLLKSILTAHNQLLSPTRSIPYWTMSVFSSAVTNDERRIPEEIFATELSWTQLTSRRPEYRSPPWTIRACYSVFPLPRKVLNEPLPSNDLFQLIVTEKCVSGSLANNRLFRIQASYQNILSRVLVTIDRVRFGNWIIHHFQVVTTNNYYTFADLHTPNHSTLIFLVYFHRASLFFSWHRIYNTGTIKVSLNHTFPISLYCSTCKVTYKVFLAEFNSFHDFWPHYCSLGTSELNCFKRFSVSVVNLQQRPRRENSALSIVACRLCLRYHVIAIQPVYWRANFYLATSCYIRPLRTQLPLLLAGTCLRSRGLVIRHNKYLESSAEKITSFLT
jgi:hypothetical protein